MKRAKSLREGWYRNVSVRMWGDEKFRRLFQDAKLLWLYLLTGPHTTILPGLFERGKAQLGFEQLQAVLRSTQRRTDALRYTGVDQLFLVDLRDSLVAAGATREHIACTAAIVVRLAGEGRAWSQEVEDVLELVGEHLTCRDFDVRIRADGSFRCLEFSEQPRVQ